MVVNDDLERT